MAFVVVVVLLSAGYYVTSVLMFLATLIFMYLLTTDVLSKHDMTPVSPRLFHDTDLTKSCVVFRLFEGPNNCW